MATGDPTINNPSIYAAGTPVTYSYVSASNYYTAPLVSTDMQGNVTISNQQGDVAIDGPAVKINGTVVVNGQDLDERLERIERMLQIPPKDVELEKKHPKLKELYDQYMAALEQYRTWERLQT